MKITSRNKICLLTAAFAFVALGGLAGCDDTKTEGGKCNCKVAAASALASPHDFCQNAVDDSNQSISFISTVPTTPQEKSITEFHQGSNCQGKIIGVK